MSRPTDDTPSRSSGRNWDAEHYHGRNNRWPFTEVVSFVMRRFGGAQRDRVRVLDLGFGGAHHLLFLAREGFDYFGIDGAQSSLKIATERLSELGYGADKLTVGTFDALPYDDDFFHCVLDRGALVSNPKRQLPTLIGELHRVLAPGGALLSMFLNRADTSNQGARDLGDGDYCDLPGRLSGAGMLHYTTAEEAAALFAAFEIEDIELSLRRSEYPPAHNATVSAWTIVTCRKR